MTAEPPIDEQLGATAHGAGTRFLVSSGVAERIELCLFDPDGVEQERVDLQRGDGDLWRADVAGAGIEIGRAHV